MHKMSKKLHLLTEYLSTCQDLMQLLEIPSKWELSIGSIDYGFFFIFPYPKFNQNQKPDEPVNVASITPPEEISSKRRYFEN